MTLTKDKPTTKRFPIVGIGASAGGLEALDELLDHLPPDTGMSFVILTHQHPGHTSMLPELLSRETKMPVVAAANGIQLQPDHVYVGTPGGRLTIHDGILRRIEEDTLSDRLPIDSFFRSLAEDQKEYAICIVLSGTGSDGTLGLKAIKAGAGMAMVQLSHSAKFAGMPSSAEATGMADYVLAPSEMPEQLIAYARGPFLSGTRSSGNSSPAAQPLVIEAEPMAKLLKLLRTHTGHDFSGYKVNTIRRRIERRMNIHQITQPEAYVRFLEQTPHEIELLFKELLISVTSFFRDPESWETLAKGPLTQLMKSLRDNATGGDKTLRVWVPGCATGEEVYTLAIVMRECAEKLKLRFNYQIFGTDLDSAAIESARLGRFPAGINADVSPERLERYFSHDDGHYIVRKEIREMAVFAPQNLIKDPPFTKLDIITCRNLLIYLDAELQKQLMPIFHYALNPGGLMMLGSSETTGHFDDLFETVDKKWKIYRRKGSSPAVHNLPEMPSKKNEDVLRTTAPSSVVSQVRQSQIAVLLERIALDRFCPTFVVVNPIGDLVHVHGRTGDYFELAEGHARTNVLDMAREGLPHELASIIRLASSTEHEVIRKEVRVKTNGDYIVVHLAAQKITKPEPVTGLIFITFRPAETACTTVDKESTDQVIPAGQVSDSKILTRELQFLRETHQETLQELETSNEELKSANEELQSTNEEMQSTNEELETSKEEMQSLNEELTTVNVELQSKVNDLSQANDDMQNLLNSTDIATIFLDDDLQINRYTVQAPQIVSLRPSDMGRPLSELTSKLKNVDLGRDCKAVLDTLVPKKQRVETIDGTWYLMRILPYRTTDKVIDGLVLTFVNIQELKDAETTAKLRTYFESIFNAVRQPLVVLDKKFAVLSANQYFYDTFQLQISDVIGHSLYEIDKSAWDQPKLKDAIDAVLAENATLDDLEIEQESANRGKKKFTLSVRRLGNTLPVLGHLLLTMREIAE